MKHWQARLIAAVVFVLPVAAPAATPPDPCKLASASNVAAAVSGPTGRGQSSADSSVFNERRCRWTGAGGRLADVALHDNPAALATAKSVEDSAAKPMNSVVPGAIYAEGKIAFLKHGFYVVVQTVNPTTQRMNTASSASPPLVKFAQAVERRL
ncbi:MAG: hypothetical protein ABR591_06255 [Candidatus Velthaea sp.]